MKVFLDLEETVIESWTDHRLCNLQNVRRFLKDCKVSEVTIFSFAIYDDRDKQIFETELKPLLESALEVKIIAWPSVDEIIKEICWKHGTIFEIWEFINIWGKAKAFYDFCRASQTEDCVLLDDVVEDEFIFNKKTGLKFETINVKGLS